jgi:hypothetical protein
MVEKKVFKNGSTLRRQFSVNKRLSANLKARQYSSEIYLSIGIQFIRIHDIDIFCKSEHFFGAQISVECQSKES